MIRRALLLALVWGGVGRAQAPVIRISDLGPGEGPKAFARALEKPYSVIAPGSTPTTLPRDSVYQHTVIILGRDVAVLGSVHGDVIVVAGNLFLRPGSAVTGRVMAIGGGVYESTIAIVDGGIVSHRDFTYDITPIASGFSLRYRSLVDVATTTFSLPGLFGIRVPNYDRSNGLSVPFAPRISLAQDRFIAEPRVTYRSQLGTVDPWGDVRYDFGEATRIQASGGRGTFTNEGWISHDLINSAASLWSGDDARNYFRGTRTNASVSHRWESRDLTIEPYLGARWESMRGVRPDSGADGGPWSFRGRHDLDDMLRPNPRINDGQITSALFGGLLEWSDDHGLAARLKLDGEWGHLSPVSSLTVDSVSTTFAQTTLQGSISFPTFGTQSLRFEGHALITLSGTAPRQRWAYLGGAGTVPTLSLLSRGGDELFFIDARYNIPIERWQVPLLGPPTVSLVEILGGADVQRMPSLAQATGVRIAMSVLYAELLVNPANRHGRFSAGLAITR